VSTVIESRDPLATSSAMTGGLARLSPAYFGMVMATGIVSLAAHLLGRPGLARALWIANIGFYAVLGTLTVLRVVRFRRFFFEDLVDHLRGPGFFTTVAASSILGVQFVLLGGNDRVGLALWVVAIVLWVAFTYAIFAALTIKENKPSLDQGISGGWLLAVVATQSIAVLSALLAAHLDQPHKLRLNFLALSMWLWGGMLYIWMVSLIFYRYTFFRFSPGDLSPPYWINMGAMAISALAGSQLILNAPDAPLLLSLLPFLKGFTIFYWATGTWWIPMLLILATWRYVYRRFPLKYDPLYWGAVFPLGMYAVSTHELGRAIAFESIQVLPPVFFFVALAAWTAASIGLVRSLLRRRLAVSRRGPFPSPPAAGETG
jgi:tellurite resistance protein TehA-like permease